MEVEFECGGRGRLECTVLELVVHSQSIQSFGSDYFVQTACTNVIVRAYYPNYDY